MKEFDVTITETLKLTVSVEASSKEEAQQMVSDQWHAGDHILDADNFVEVEFESNDGKEISAKRAPDNTIAVSYTHLSPKGKSTLPPLRGMSLTTSISFSSESKSGFDTICMDGKHSKLGGNISQEFI